MTTDTSKVKFAVKWSVFSEVLTKVIAPITTIILARLLSQEVFGIVASLMAITSLAYMLADAGFNEFIVQHQFDSEKEKQDTYNICFWTNISIALVLLAIIIVFNDFFSRLVGAEGYGHVLIVAAFEIPLVSISALERAILKKELNFKSLGIIKITSKLTPFFVTIPLALFGFGYWSLVCGSLAGEFIGLLLCVYHAKFIPSLSYPTVYLRRIFSFSSGAYTDSILEWLIDNVAIMSLATLYGMVELGIFKVTVNLATQISNSIYALYVNVYKSAIAKEQFNLEGFRKIFLAFQKYASIVSLPLGVAIFLYSDLVTRVMLGEKWMEASTFLGLYCLICSFSVSFGNFYSDAIRAKGHPWRLAMINATYLLTIVILLTVAPNLQFAQFCIIFSLLKLIQPLLQTLVGRKTCCIPVRMVFMNSYPQICAVLMMVGVHLILKSGVASLHDLISAPICILTYLIILYILSPNIFHKLRVDV